MQIKDCQIVLLGVMIAIGSVCSAYVLSKSIVEFQKLQNQTIKVTGSASMNVTSDFASWTVNFKTKQATLKECYSRLNSDAGKIKTFLLSNGIDEKDIEFFPINSGENYMIMKNGIRTNQIESYNAWQEVTVKSNDINKINNISKKVNILINQDINLTNNNVQYFVTNIDDIKIKMVGEASKNAKERAKSIVKGTNSKIGVMNGARMGVFQIIPVNSTEVSDYGYNDTQSLEKKVVATVTATFTVK